MHIKKYYSFSLFQDFPIDPNLLSNQFLDVLNKKIIYKSNFKKSVNDYNRILENDSISFDGNLGKANALKALGYYNDAYTYMLEQAEKLDIHPRKR